MGSLRLAMKRSLDEDEIKQNPSLKNSPTKKRSTATTSPTTVTLIPPKKTNKKGNKKRKKSLSTQLNNVVSVKEGDEAAAVVAQPPKIKIRLGIKKKSTNKVSAKPNTAPRVGEVGYEFRKNFNNKRWYIGKVVEIRPTSGKYLYHCSKKLSILF